MKKIIILFSLIFSGYCFGQDSNLSDQNQLEKECSDEEALINECLQTKDNLEEECLNKGGEWNSTDKTCSVEKDRKSFKCFMAGGEWDPISKTCPLESFPPEAIECFNAGGLWTINQICYNPRSSRRHHEEIP